MIIEYELGYRNQKPVICCGRFRDMKHFEVFTKVEAFAGRIVQEIIHISE